MMDFRPIILDDKYNIKNLFAGKGYIISEYSFSYMMLWREVVKFEICDRDDALFIRAEYDNIRRYFLPVIKNGTMDECYKLLEEYADINDRNWRLVCAEEINISEFSEKFKESYLFEEDINSFDYIYLPENLIKLSGKKYHAKRNHISKFNSLYDYEFLPLTKDNFSECLGFDEKWKNSKPEEMGRGTKEELMALENAFRYFEQLGLFGAYIKIDGKMAGFTIGEINENNIGVVHFEKCDQNYEGIYSAINRMFAEKHFSKVRYVNRQEDMGLYGLRKSKQSYHPVFMGKKYYMKRREAV